MNRAFLIGAGATKAEYGNAPICNDFFNKLRSNNSKHFKAMNDAIGPYISGKLENQNVENVMGLIHKFPLANRTSYLHSLHLAISEIIVPATHSNSEYIDGYVKGEITTPSTHFRTLFQTGELDKNDFFMTLNYDLYLDREILYEQGKINYGFKKDNIAASIMNYVYEEEFSIYHLHGALNWEIVSNKIKIYCGAYNPKYKGTGFNLCLVPPGFSKNHPLLDPIWKSAENRLRHADELIIIGCSLNPMDKELIDLIKGFVNRKGRGKVKIVYKAEKTPDYFHMDEKYSKIIGNKFMAYRDGFNNAAINFILEK